jgi:hypothetical protein
MWDWPEVKLSILGMNGIRRCLAGLEQTLPSFFQRNRPSNPTQIFATPTFISEFAGLLMWSPVSSAFIWLLRVIGLGLISSTSHLPSLTYQARGESSTALAPCDVCV